MGEAPVGTWERGLKWVKRRPAVAGLLGALAAVIALGFALVLWQRQQAEDRAEEAEAALRREAEARTGRSLAQVQALLEANPQAVPNLLKGLEPVRQDVLPRLRRLWRQPGLPERHRLRVALALLAVEPAAVRGPLLAGMLRAADPHEVVLLRDGLWPCRNELKAALWQKARPGAASPGQRFRALVALATLDPDGRGWREFAPRTVEQLVAVDTLHLAPWMEALRPLRRRLLGPLGEVFRGDKRAERRLAAAIVLADYTADRPAELLRLALDADARQYRVLLPVLQARRPAALALLQAELARQAVPDWKDAPPAAAWPRPEAALVGRVEAAHGLVAEHFALCQDLPLGQLRALAEGLGRSGYRPVRVRPYAVGPKTLVAVVWQRDGRVWRLTLDASAQAVQEQEANNHREGYVPVDVAGFGPDGQRYTAVWVKALRGEEGRFYLGVPDANHLATMRPLQDAGFVPLTLQALVLEQGRPYYCSVWRKGKVTWASRWRAPLSWYEGAHLEGLTMDVSLVRRTNQVEAVRPELQGWLSGGLAAGAAGLPWAGLYRRGRSPLVPGPNSWYAGVWHLRATMESARLQGLAPDEHLRRCRELAARGYRPAALSVAALTEGRPLVAASVWHRPVVPEGVKDALASRQANAAVTLLDLGRADVLWPLLRHTPDPRRRTYLIHRLAQRVSARLLLRRLRKEKEVSARRALLLALGEYPEAERPPGERAALVPGLLALYRDHPDPGLHGAVDWLLRRWGRSQELARIDRELISSGVRGERHWYVNGQRQTFTVVRGPREFLMGSPGSAPNRRLNEVLHRRRIARSFAIATKPVTVAEFEEFRRAYPDFRHSYIKMFSPEPGCPIINVSWYQAAMYCQWLSEREGVPREQWCYPPVAEFKALRRARKPVPLPADYLTRTGYRLPTEAEWEYACRAGAVTSRYYGEAGELLGEYAWCARNSPERTRPVGLLKPNDLGLFDMLGNVMEWCQDRSLANPAGRAGGMKEDSEDINNIVTDTENRVARGRAYLAPAVNVRSAWRAAKVPTWRDRTSGFRPARTYR
jgi:formylglycine-generating enzyme required for sulfatase activity